MVTVLISGDYTQCTRLILYDGFMTDGDHSRTSLCSKVTHLKKKVKIYWNVLQLHDLYGRVLKPTLTMNGALIASANISWY